MVDASPPFTEGENMQNSGSDMQAPEYEIAFRRQKVMEGLAQGKSQRQLADELKVHESTISRDVQAIYDDLAQEHAYFTDVLFKEQQKALVGLSLAQRKLWAIVEHSNDNGEVMQALAIISKIYDQKLGVVAGKFLKDVSTFNIKEVVSRQLPSQQIGVESN